MAARPGPTVAVAVLSSVFPFVLSACASDTPDTAMSDRRLVYCLAQERQRTLIDAAIRLNLAEESKTAGNLVLVRGRDDIPVADWRGADFERACDAVMAASRNQAPTSGTPQWVTTLLTTVNAVVLLLVGAVVTLLTGGLKDAGTRRRVTAGELRTSADKFVTIFEAYLDAKEQPRRLAEPTQNDIRERRQELAGVLRAAHAVHKGSPDPQPSLTLLKDVLGESALRDWELQDAKETPTRVTAMRESVKDLTKEIGVVTDWLERSLLSRLGGAK